ncbi:uncharacterized protein VTP21DRAFT_2118 [Calcarisporiella thermophila]|uniref:uncharacterized protein n=1 Tax=Calcarisporiella thermophila TaxID=911321 RepID=UPI0037426BCB
MVNSAVGNFSSISDKSQFYAELLSQCQSLIEGERYWVTNLANLASLIYHGLNDISPKHINWAGFYVATKNNPEELTLGPFQGKVACTRIPFGKGVCGEAAASRNVQIVPDVHKFPGHIACDSASNSEIVIPLVHENRVVGVLDIDCEEIEGFDEQDKAGLVPIAQAIVDGCNWSDL